MHFNIEKECLFNKDYFDTANYNPDEDEYYEKKTNGFLSSDTQKENNNSPILLQPGANNRIQRNISQR